MTTARTRVAAVLAVVGVAGIVVALAAAAGPGDLLSGGDESTHPRGAGPSAARVLGTVVHPHDGTSSAGDPVHHSSTVGAVIAAVVIVLAAWIFGQTIWRLLQRSRRGRVGTVVVPDETLDPLRDAERVAARLARTAAEQRGALATGVPRDAVIACWLAFETAAEGAGVPRREWETSTEFTVRLLGLVHADRDAVRRLAALFREARFSTHPMGEDARDAALAALDEIHASLPATVAP